MPSQFKNEVIHFDINQNRSVEGLSIEQFKQFDSHQCSPIEKGIAKNFNKRQPMIELFEERDFENIKQPREYDNPMAQSEILRDKRRGPEYDSTPKI